MKIDSYSISNSHTGESLAFVLQPKNWNIYKYEVRQFGTISAQFIAAPKTPIQHTRPNELGYYFPKPNPYFSFLQQIEQLSELDSQWNGSDSDVPNALSREIATYTVFLLSSSNLMPDRVAPSADGGVGICFRSGQRYADIEILNSGTILAVKSDGTGKPKAWEVNAGELKSAVRLIRDYISA